MLKIDNIIILFFRFVVKPPIYDGAFSIILSVAANLLSFDQIAINVEVTLSLAAS